MTYEGMSHFAQTWGLAFLVVLFLAGVGYAFWPKNKDKFRRAARLPLRED